MTSVLQKFLKHDTHPFVQFIKYGMAGGLATVADISIFYFLSWLVLPALTENDRVVQLFHLTVTPVTQDARFYHYIVNRTITFAIANMVAYVANILWVFKPGRHSRWKEIGLFYLVSGISYVLGTGMSSALIKLYDVTTTLAYLVNIFFSLAINYVCRKFLIFKG